MDYFAEKITQFVRKNEEKYCQLSQEIWRYAELAFHEDYLRDHFVVRFV